MYEALARVYDRLMADVPYARFGDWFDDCVAQAGRPPARLLDVGCGTGAMLPHWLKSVRTVVGVDPSEAMLAVARERMAGDRRVTLLCQHAQDLRLPAGGECDWAAAICDVVNHIEPEMIQEAFARVHDSLRSSGLFLFDVLTPWRLRESIGDGVFYDISDDTVCLMTTAWEQASGRLTYRVHLFAREAGDRYVRADEIHVEYAYGWPFLRDRLAAAGFCDVAVGADFKTAFGRGLDIPGGRDGTGVDRWFVAARRS